MPQSARSWASLSTGSASRPASTASTSGLPATLAGGGAHDRPHCHLTVEQLGEHAAAGAAGGAEDRDVVAGVRALRCSMIGMDVVGGRKPQPISQTANTISWTAIGAHRRVAAAEFGSLMNGSGSPATSIMGTAIRPQIASQRGTRPDRSSSQASSAAPTLNAV